MACFWSNRQLEVDEVSEFSRRQQTLRSRHSSCMAGQGAVRHNDANYRMSFEQGVFPKCHKHAIFHPRVKKPSSFTWHQVLSADFESSLRVETNWDIDRQPCQPASYQQFRAFTIVSIARHDCPQSQSMAWRWLADIDERLLAPTTRCLLAKDHTRHDEVPDAQRPTSSCKHSSPVSSQILRTADKHDLIENMCRSNLPKILTTETHSPFIMWPASTTYLHTDARSTTMACWHVGMLVCRTMMIYAKEQENNCRRTQWQTNRCYLPRCSPESMQIGLTRSAYPVQPTLSMNDDEERWMNGDHPYLDFDLCC